MAVGDILLATVVQTLHGQTIMNSCHFRESSTGAGDAQALLALGIDAAVTAQWKPKMSDEWHYDYVQVQKVYPGPPSYPAINGTGAGYGGVAGDAVPTSVAYCITKRTALAGPKYRGRLYITGFPVADLGDSVLSPTGITNQGSVGLGLIAQFTNGGYTWDPVIFHRSDNTYHMVVGPVLRSTIRNQRRRQSGKGV